MTDKNTIQFFVPGKPKAQGSLSPFCIPAIKNRIAEKITMLANPRTRSNTLDIIYKLIIKYTNVPQDKKVLVWRDIIRHVAKSKVPWQPDDSAISIGLGFFMLRPKSDYRTGKYSDQLKSSSLIRPTKKNYGDIDKHERSVLDALSGVAYKDDSQVTDVVKWKKYCSTEDRQGVLIKITKKPNQQKGE